MSALILYVLVWLVSFLIPATIAFLLLSLPLYRQQRALMFLDLLESGLAAGHSAERTLLEAAETHDRSIGRQFHLLASCLNRGLRLSAALSQVPRFLPARLVAMLAVGEHVGDVRKVMPACRRMVTAASSKMMAAQNYVLVVPFAFNLVAAGMVPFLLIVIFPKFKEIFAEMLGGKELPPVTRFMLAHARWLVGAELAVTALLFVIILFYMAGPQLLSRFGRMFKPIADGLTCHLPWRWKRLQRDFSAMLGILLDAGVPEADAVMLAARSTDNGIFIRRAERVFERLGRGVTLMEAVQALDDTGEFRWRLTNAAHGHGGFLVALAGWHDALDAKAYQQEQAVSQLFTTGIVLFNGCIVAVIVVGVFQVLTTTVQEVALW